ncbi:MULTISPECIES: hypothetical protein [Burkholderia]|uniref:Uncharacterized protein n=1 Tax=Burkholderia anthina TaxID=179879 RepID=A0ABS2BAU5_9BURK|nr:MULTISPECIES: hypothetical protein [Burkholderia]MBM2770106.1 hypothetical protein [Burkholderia anthina]QTD88664.1 hypothetical protein J4G50_12610 [Burkholderia anthina]
MNRLDGGPRGQVAGITHQDGRSVDGPVRAEADGGSSFPISARRTQT